MAIIVNIDIPKYNTLIEGLFFTYALINKLHGSTPAERYAYESAECLC